MPVSYTPVQKSAVLQILSRRGYGLDSCPGYEFRLTRPIGPKRKQDGVSRLVPIGGIRRPDWRRIAKFAKDDEDAANQCEAICTGKELTGSSAGPEPTNGVDMTMLAQLVDNRVAGKLAEQDHKLDRLTSLMERFLLHEAAPEGPATLPPVDAAVPEQPEAVMGYEPEAKPKRPHPGKGKTRVKVDGKWRWVPKPEAVAQ